MMPARHRFPPFSPATIRFLLALWLLSSVAGATTFVALDDAALADGAQVIVEGQVLAIEPAPGERPAVDYLVAIDRVIKGGLPAGVVLVRVPGGVRPDGVGLLLRGAPRFREGDEALLFLEPRRDGTFGLHQFLLGAFHLEDEDGTRIARRELAGARRIELPGREEPADGRRDAEGFRHWLEARAAGRTTEADYFLPAAPGGEEKYAVIVSTTDPLPFGCGDDGGHRVRWFDFTIGAGTDVGWRAHYSGQAGVPDGGIEALQAALAAWSDDPNSAVRYVFDGLTGAGAGFTGNDGVNAVLFDDPNDEIGGSFDGSGVLALGGPWFNCITFEYRGERYHPIVSADIVTQDGLGPFFTALPEPEIATEQLFAHELGHTLGLAHSTDTEALMFGQYHPDLRGAALDTDDLAGMLHLYGSFGPSPPSPPPPFTAPAAPSGLAATDTGAGTVALVWSDNSSNESVFRIERRHAETWVRVRAAAADSTSFIDVHVEPATLYGYRLTAINGAGDSATTGVAEVLTAEDPRPAVPTNLRAAPLSSTEVRLTWQDNSSDETGFMVEILIPPDWVEIPVLLPPDTRKLIVEGLPAAASVSFRLRAVNDFGASDASNHSTTTTFENDDNCVVTGDDLCLLGGRFKISVDYRNQYDGGSEGTGTVVPSTDETGLFWFSGPQSVELIVKALDGRSHNDHFWLFYGALSDLEYSITVTDTATDTVATYHNPPGEICGLADTGAFPDELPEPSAGGPLPVDVTALRLVPVADDSAAPGASASAPKSGTCEPGPQTLCLLDSRLSVDVRWRNQYAGGVEGPGWAIADSDSSGLFWFFNIENAELVVKALDGGALNDHLWLFWGALTDLEYWITVTDTATGDSHVYYNPPGEVCGGADTQAFDAVPPGEPPPGGDPGEPPVPAIPDE